MNEASIRFSPDRASRAFPDLRTEVFARLRTAPARRYATKFGWIKAFSLGAACALSYGNLLKGGVGGVSAISLALTAGLCLLLLALNASHDAAHGVFARSPWINSVVLYVPFAVLGVDPAMWRARHVFSHHRFPNVDRCDADIDENPFIRLSPHQPRRPWHRWQHLYAWFLYLIVAPHAVWIQDVNYMKRTSLANMHDWSARTPSWLSFVTVKIIHAAVFYALPLCYLDFDWRFILIGSLGTQALLSMAFILPLIGTHFSSAAEFPEIESGDVGCSYVSHQLRTSVDWSPRSRTACNLIGGLNAHAAHHLFPNVSHAHYPWISAAIKSFCAEHALPYREVALSEAVYCHYRFLRNLS